MWETHEKRERVRERKREREKEREKEIARERERVCVHPYFLLGTCLSAKERT